MKLKRQSLLSPGSILRLMQAARDTAQRGDIHQGIEILQRASQLDPANYKVWLFLGALQTKAYDFVAAEGCFERGIRMASNKLEALMVTGQSCRESDNPIMAERYYRRALEAKADSPDTLVKLAEACERLRRLPEATELADRALQLDAACQAARLLRAKLDRRAGRLAEAENRLRPLRQSSDRVTHVQACYELAALFDRQGRYDEAMTALLEAKALARSDAAPWAARNQVRRKLLEETRTWFTAEKLRAWRDSAPALQPTRRLALLCGHARSGTTLLWQVLDSHPDVASIEETTIFHTYAFLTLARHFPENTNSVTAVLDSAPLNVLQAARQNFFRGVETCLRQPVGGRCLIDKNPSANVMIPRYLRIFPELKLLVALRDPRDVCISCFMQPFYSKGPTSPTILSLEEEVTSYGNLMGWWTALAPVLKDCALEVRYEDMVEDLGSVARKTLEFLGLGWDERVLKFNEHAQQKFLRSPTYAEVTRPVFKTAKGRWRNYQKYLEPHLKPLEPFVQALGYE